MVEGGSRARDPSGARNDTDDASRGRSLARSLNARGDMKAAKTAAKAAAKKALTKMDSPLALIAGVTVGVLALGIVVQVLLIVASIFAGKGAPGSRPKRDRKPTPKALEAAPAAKPKKASPAKKSSSKKVAAPAPVAAPVPVAAKAAPVKKTSSKVKKAAPAKKTSSKGIASPRRSSRTPTKKSK